MASSEVNESCIEEISCFCDTISSISFETNHAFVISFFVFSNSLCLFSIELFKSTIESFSSSFVFI